MRYLLLLQKCLYRLQSLQYKFPPGVPWSEESSCGEESALSFFQFAYPFFDSFDKIASKLLSTRILWNSVDSGGKLHIPENKLYPSPEVPSNEMEVYGLNIHSSQHL